MKTFATTQFIYEPKQNAYKAMLCDLGCTQLDLINGFRIGKSSFVPLKLQHESAVFVEEFPRAGDKPKKVFIVGR